MKYGFVIVAISLFFLLENTGEAAGADLQDSLTNLQNSETVATQEAIIMNEGEIYRTEVQKEEALSLTYLFPNGDEFYQQRSATGGAVTFFVNGEAGTARYYDSKTNDWQVNALTGQKQYNCMIHVTIDQGKEMILCPANAWEQIENQSIRNILTENGTVTIHKEEDGFTVTFTWPQPVTADYSDFFYLKSDLTLIDWNNEVISRIWKGYQFSGDGRWCYDGFYFRSPSTYEPNGPQIFNLNPASYTPARLVCTGGSRASDDLGIAMLDIIRRQYNVAGYIPSKAQSLWLFKEYEIAANYFDDRFNTDVAYAYYVGYRKFGIQEFKSTYLNYANFLLERSKINFYTVSDGTQTGKMLQDYWHPAGNKGTHCSLNHQLAVILFLYKTEDPKYTVVAEQLLMGIKVTRDRWIKPNGDLYYAFLSNGRYGMQDYPYLSYNDLYNLQVYLTGYKGKPDSDLAVLMKAKKDWMDRNGVTQYYH